MGAIQETGTAEGLLAGLRLARGAIGRGELVVMPTDTVYGIAADAFNPEAVRALVAAKGRTLAAPPPVLIASLAALDALAEEVHDDVRRLAERFWPGALTIIVPARSSLSWDLGDTRGTVALRMPDDAIALELLTDTGPLAVSSANRTGQPPATTAREAFYALGESVAVVLDAGPRGSAASTIVDATALPDGPLRLVRAGAVPLGVMRGVVDTPIVEPGTDPGPAAASPGSDAAGPPPTAGSDADAASPDPETPTGPTPDAGPA